MKDREKQIEEMAKVICNACKTRVSEQQCNSNKRAIYGWCSMCEIITEELLKHYQPKLPKDSVVLTREEYEKLLESNKNLKYSFDTASSYIEKLAESCEKNCKKFNGITTQQARKEAAEKFAKDIFKHITTPEVWEKLRQQWLSKDGNFVANKHIYDLLIEPIAKQFSGEIDNSVEHKEITTEKLLEMGKKRNELKLAEKITVSNNKDSVEIKE